MTGKASGADQGNCAQPFADSAPQMDSMSKYAIYKNMNEQWAKSNPNWRARPGHPKERQH
jgi:hypothetical protein